MRIAIGQLWQETNTFNPIRTTRADFEQFGVLSGRELIERMADSNELGGFITSLRAWNDPPEIVGLARFPAWPAGLATADTFTWLRDEMAAALTQALPVDGVLLALHGSMAAEGVPDVEGEVLGILRSIVGRAVPIVATLDLHANITEKMVRESDALVLYHTIPHVDVLETGVRGAELMRRILQEGARPTVAFQKLPMVVPAERANTQDPVSVSFAIRARLQELEAEPAVLTAGIATVQPWLDIPEMGSSVLVVTDGDPARAQVACTELAQVLWDRRREYLPELVSVQDGVRAAFECQDGLTVLSDSADATTSGAPGDSTHMLRELLRYDWKRPALVPIVSPEAVREAEERGAGAEWEVRIGGVRDSQHSQPVATRVVAERLFDGQFMLSGHLGRNLAIDMGRCAVLRHGNVFVIATSRSGPHFAPELFQCGGLYPFAAQAMIAKSPCGFRAAYAEAAKQIFVVRTPGCAPSDFWNYPYTRIPRPLWPWDEIDDWRPSASIAAP